jgi:branched-chain amino acid transport system substrate-binding protein
VLASGGKVLGAKIYPFPETTDFSSQLLEAKASGAKVIGLCNAGLDTINCLKQASEFGLVQSGVKMAAMLGYMTDVHSIGLQYGQGLLLTESYYWDLNDRTRRFNDRAKPHVKIWPNMTQAGNYSATLHYLKTVTAMGVAEAKKSGAATVARMKAMPTDDDVFGAGSIREDGRKLHAAYLLEGKKPSESKHEWDVMKLVATTPANEAFRPLSESACPWVKKA